MNLFVVYFQLEAGDNAKYYQTLNLFAYGSYRDYLSNKEKYLELTPVMTKKLQHLTIVSMFFKSGKCIPYESLLEELQISSVRNLEDLIIDGLSLSKFTNFPNDFTIFINFTIFLYSRHYSR